MGTSNDIVINAKATTAAAEKSINALDAKIQALAANSPKVQQLEGRLAGVGRQAAKTSQTLISSEKATGAGFAALQGSITGVLTKLGVLGLAVAAVKTAWDALNKVQQKTIDTLNKTADASNKYFTAFKSQSDSILDSLQQLDKLAADGYLDNESLRQTNSLVAQLNSLWGDVGLSVDQTTGKINGLESATAKINAGLRAMALEGAKARAEAARLGLGQAQRNKAAEFNADGSMTTYGAAKAALSIDNATAFYSGSKTAGGIQSDRRGELDAAIKTAQADLLAAEAEVKRLEAQTTAESIAATVARGKAELAAQEAAQKAGINLANMQAGYGGLDLQELGLRQALAAAQAGGGDVAGAQAALDSYTSTKNQARYTYLTNQIERDKAAQADAQERYNVGLKHGDVGEITKRLEALIEANKALESHSAEAQRLAAGMYKPATPDKLPAAEAMRSTARGTFDAFGLGGLSGGNIQQQQLDVQKQIERNTQQLAVPVVGE